MPDKPSVSTEQRPEAVVVTVLAHDLDDVHMEAVRSAIAAALTAAPSLPFIIDLTNVKFVPSLTLGALVRLVNEFRARSQRLIFVAMQPAVRKVISITRLDRIMEIMDSANTALRSVGSTS